MSFLKKRMGKKVAALLLFLTSYLSAVSVQNTMLEQVSEAIISSIQSNNTSRYIQALQDLKNIDGMPDAAKVTFIETIINEVGEAPVSLNFTNGLSVALPDNAGNLSYTNSGSGKGIFKEASGNLVVFRTLSAGTNMTLTEGADTITIATTAEANTASNVGGGVEVFKQKSGADLQFRSFIAGTNVGLSNLTNDIGLFVDNPEITATATAEAGHGYSTDVTSTFYFEKMGRLVVMYIPRISTGSLATDAAYMQFPAGTIPSGYRPLINDEEGLMLVHHIRFSSSVPSSKMIVYSDGSFRIYYKNDETNVAAGALVDIRNKYLTWLAAS